MTVNDVIKSVSERYNLLVFIRERGDVGMYEVDNGIITIPPEILKKTIRKKRMNKNKHNIHVEIDI